MTGSARGWLLLGAGGHAASVADVLARSGRPVVAVVGSGTGWQAVTRFDTDDEALQHAAEHRLPVAVAVGDNRGRLTLVGTVLASGAQAPPLVATTATAARDAQLEHGCVLMEHSHAGPRAVLGRGALINTGAVVEHDAVVGTGSHIAPGARLLGAAGVGSLVLVGAGATVLPGVQVGDGAVVGAGAVVTSAVPPAATVVGAPARPVGNQR